MRLPTGGDTNQECWGDSTYEDLIRGPTFCFFEGGSAGVLALVAASDGALLLSAEAVGEAVPSTSS